MIRIVSLYIVVLILSFFAISPLLSPGYFPVHDNTQVQRVQQMSKALADGMLPVRWVSDLGYGYGYPIFNFYAPLAYYFGGAIAFVGVDYVLATKMMMIVGVVLSGIGMFLLGRSIFGRNSAFVAAAFYLYAPYHAVTIYIRGAVGEYFAYAFVPFVFYAIWEIVQRKQFRFVVVGAVALAFVALSHNLTTLMIMPLVLLAMIFLMIQARVKKEKKHVLYLFLMLLLAILLSAFYWLPALAEMNYTNVSSQIGGGANFLDHFVCPSQLWESQWGFGGSTKGCLDGMSFRIGKLHILFAILSLPLFFLLRNKRKNLAILIFSWIGLLFGIFLTLPLSSFVWETIVPMAYIQYPWRYLSIIALFSSFLGAWGASFIVEKIETKTFFKKTGWIMTFLIILAIVLFNARLFTPHFLTDVQSSFLVEKNNLRFISSKISDEYMPAGFQKPVQLSEVPDRKFSVSSGDASIVTLQDKTQVQSVKVTSHGPSKLLLATAYFPAWKLRLDDTELNYQKSQKGILFQVPDGVHVVMAQFVQTGIEQLANYLSMIGLCLTIIGIIIAKKKNNL